EATALDTCEATMLKPAMTATITRMRNIGKIPLTTAYYPRRPPMFNSCRLPDTCFRRHRSQTPCAGPARAGRRTRRHVSVTIQCHPVADHRVGDDHAGHLDPRGWFTGQHHARASRTRRRPCALAYRTRRLVSCGRQQER